MSNLFQKEFIALPFDVTMTEAVKRDWLSNLRDKKSLQIKGFLKDGATGGRCCLGVLGDVRHVQTEPATPNHHIRNSANALFFVFASKGRDATNLPDLYSGMTLAMTGLLANFNDRGKSFRQIARFIESHIYPSYPGIRILNHLPDQYYVYVFDGSRYQDERFAKKTLVGNRYTFARYPNETVTLFTRKQLRAFLRQHQLL